MKINTQPVEKKVSSDLVDVQEIFHTIQGEGPYAGKAAIFIRLAGCNLQCPYCDTDYTSARKLMTVEEVMSAVGRIQSEYKRTWLVVITGGEPFRQQVALPLLAEALLSEDFLPQIETNGTLWISHKAIADSHIVVSPKTGSVHPEIEAHAVCFKYVASAEDIDPLDGLPTKALGHSAVPRLARPRQVTSIFLQPADHYDPIKNKANMDAVVKSCMEFGYRLNLQLHKIIGVA